MMTSIILKLGTRRSLLAWAQSSWVAREVERLNPGVCVELQGIETRGDRILDVPLQSIQGKEFFVAEIDQALAAGEVDFTVHSMKDLSLERPSALICGAIPKRENPRDVILFGPQALHNARSGKSLKIGTSSPRRIENIPGFLERAFPRVQFNIEATDLGRPQFEFKEIRGNVNTRLSRVHESVDSEKYLDGVVLAFAGLIRLWNDPMGQKEMSRLLQGVRWMVLPLKECPSAPAQGALAIECRANDEKVKNILSRLHNEQTARQVTSERQLLADWGGGCHQRFGATSIQTEYLGEVLFIQGVKPDGNRVSEVTWQAPVLSFSSLSGIRAWDGSSWRAKGRPKGSTPFEVNLNLENKAVFVAHSRALGKNGIHQIQNARVWTSGTPSWFRLADQGVWVEGCAEGLGFEHLEPTLREASLGLSALKDWIILTHSDALEDWVSKGFRAIATYKVNSDYGPHSSVNDRLNYGEAAKSALKEATHVFWSSGTQFDELKEYIQPMSRQACGPGKTVAHLREAGVEPEVFPSVEEWRKWLKIT